MALEGVVELRVRPLLALVLQEERPTLSLWRFFVIDAGGCGWLMPLLDNGGIDIAKMPILRWVFSRLFLYHEYTSNVCHNLDQAFKDHNCYKFSRLQVLESSMEIGLCQYKKETNNK